MPVIKAAIIGYGTVGKSLYDAIKSHQSELIERLGYEVRIEKIVVRNPAKARPNLPDATFTSNAEDLFSIPDLKIVFEAAVGAETVYPTLVKAVKKGCHIITANKVFFSKYGTELKSLARKEGVQVGYEAAVAGGIPVIRTIKHLLQVNRIESLEGILNGTSNYILTEMENKGLSFLQALKKAQQKGYAEEDPSNDVEGLDAFYKLSILAQLIYQRDLPIKKEEITGITGLSDIHIHAAEKWGLKWKHIARLNTGISGIEASIEPVLVGSSHPFYGVHGADNAIKLQTSLAGQLFLQGKGAGDKPTASAMIEDLISVLTEKTVKERAILLKKKEKKSFSCVHHAQNENYFLFKPDQVDFPEGFLRQIKIRSIFQGKSATGFWIITNGDLSPFYRMQKEWGLYRILENVEKSHSAVRNHPLYTVPYVQ